MSMSPNTNYMILKSNADGLKAVKVNPYKYDNGCSGSHPNPKVHEAKNKEYLDFESNNPELPLTKQMPGNTVFEGVEVWQYKTELGEWKSVPAVRYDEFAFYELYRDDSEYYEIETRKAYDVKEQVREEAPKATATLDDGQTIICGQTCGCKDNSECGFTPKASNPELGAEETIQELYAENKKLSNLLKLILDIDALTTKEFCDMYRKDHPQYRGSIDLAVMEMFAVDSNKWHIIKDRAKEIRKTLKQ